MVRILLLLLATSQAGIQHYLLDPYIQQAVQSGDFSGLAAVCRPQLSVNLEEPLSFKGHYSSGQFTEDFTRLFRRFHTENSEWTSIQIDENLAVQSLNLSLKDRYSGRTFFYRFIFFMNKDKEWKIYYLRGLRI